MRQLRWISFAIGIVIVLLSTSLWVRGHWWRADWVAYRNAAGTHSLDSRFGGISYAWNAVPMAGPSLPRWQCESHPTEWLYDSEPWHWWERLGFWYRRQWIASGVMSGIWIGVPNWFLVIGGIGLMVPQGRRWWGLRARRTAAGLCLACGYDLRASPERCPECGTAVSQPPGER
jgi:hypothetical protein